MAHVLPELSAAKRKKKKRQGKKEKKKTLVDRPVPDWQVWVVCTVSVHTSLSLLSTPEPVIRVDGRTRHSHLLCRYKILAQQLLAVQTSRTETALTNKDTVSQ